MPSAQFQRVMITEVHPTVDGGRWPARRIKEETVEVMAGVIADSHDKLAVELQVKDPDGKQECLRLTLRWNDEYVGTFACTASGDYTFRIRAWVDRFATWQDEFQRRVTHNAPADTLRVELLTGAQLVHEAAAQTSKPAALLRYAKAMESGTTDAALEEQLSALMSRHDIQQGAVNSPWYRVEVDAPLAGCAAWYEFFPRSAATEPGRHGTLDDAAARLEGIRDLGFDVVYLPPVHPIGSTFRKGKDNTPTAQSGEPGSPWAIGSAEGGHTSVHPELGGLAAFDRFMAQADALGLHVALDIAFQCSPDHPYVTDHPEWFKPSGGRDYTVCRKSAKKIPGRLPLELHV